MFVVVFGEFDHLCRGGSRGRSYGKYPNILSPTFTSKHILYLRQDNQAISELQDIGT